MARKNLLLETPPYAVEKAVKRLGEHIRLARLRRNLTIQEVAERIGTGARAIMDAEKGKVSTSIAVYTALLWALNLLEQLDQVAQPARDTEGMMLSIHKERLKARKKDVLDNDF